MKLQELLTQYESTASQLRQQGRTAEAAQYDLLIANCKQMIDEFLTAGRCWQPKPQA